MPSGQKLLTVILLLVYCLPSIVPANPANCGAIKAGGNACNCGYLGYSPEDSRVKTDQRKEVIIDWLLQDGMTNGLKVIKTWEKGSRFARMAYTGDTSDALDINAVKRVVKSLGENAGELRSECDKLTKSNNDPKSPDWSTLYIAACEKRRELRLKPYLDELKQVVFTKHYEFGGSHYAYTEGLSDAQHERHFQPGSHLCLMELDGIYTKVTDLIHDPGGVVRDPDISHDAKRVLFAHKKSFFKDDYHIYEMDLATKKVRQITSGIGYADYEPIYMPNGDIIFSSTRCIQSVDCWHVEVSNLFTCDKDGKYMRRLGFDQVHTTLATLSHDGRVLYTRWDYNDRGQMAVQSLFQMNPDGTNQRELYGNVSCFPTSILHTRSIPGTGKYVCITSGHHSRQRGWLAIIDPRKGRQENQGIQLIAPVRKTLARTVDASCQSDNQFKHPYPLSETAFLVSFASPVPGSRNNTVSSGTRPYGIYLMNIDGGRELLHRDHNISCTQAMPVIPRSIPNRPNTVDYTKKTGTVYMHDVYAGPGLAGIKHGTIKKLRVVGLEFRVWSGRGASEKRLVPDLKLGARNRGPVSAGLVSCPISNSGGTWDVKAVLGNATVYEDGSACFKVPARTPLFFQALDENDQMVQSMRSWATLQPGETLSCVGCHERKNQAPPIPYFSKALEAGAQDLERDAFEGPSQGFDFERDIQPIMDKHCVKCHKLEPDQPVDRAKKLAFSLSWPASYDALATRDYCNWINAQSKPTMLPPYYTGAAQSKLIKLFEPGKHTIYSPAKFGETERTATNVEGGKHYGVKMTKLEMERLKAWIDVGIPALGTYRMPANSRFHKKREAMKAMEEQSIRDLLSRDGVKRLGTTP
ncbi:MAG: hypothetical protein QGH15_10595 [Kiritimatiellia bacterium]|nr:hypothetical protein [Kiritimatiellia bacterium]